MESRKNKKISLLHGDLDLPIFMPDATFGFVRALDSSDLKDCKIQALIMNVFHLMQHPGSNIINNLGGLHKMCSWENPIITDSGGFQAYSIIRNNPKKGSIGNKGIIFKPKASKKKFILTPEKSIRLQLKFGTDMAFCLDYCTHPNDPLKIQIESVQKTIEWAKRSKIEYENYFENSKERPLLYSIIQGGKDFELREECVKALMDLEFDGYGYGGYPFDKDGNLLTEIFTYIRELVPKEIPLFALGVGSPESIVKVYKLGYTLFDSSLPTRDARIGRLYVFNNQENLSFENNWYHKIYINKEKYINSKDPISPLCDCLTCQNYSRGYLFHLFERNDSLFRRLASIHNLRFISIIMEKLRKDSNV